MLYITKSLRGHFLQESKTLLSNTAENLKEKKIT